MTAPRFEKIIAPQPERGGVNYSDELTLRDRTRAAILKVVGYWPDFRAWEVEIRDDRGRVSKDGEPIVVMIRYAGFGAWVEMPER